MRWCPGRSPRQGDGRPPWLLESHFGKASELARMQPFPLQRLELFQRLQPDVQMLAHALPVELARHAGELDLPVQRLVGDAQQGAIRSEEHTSELQSLMRISYAVFCLKKKNNTNKYNSNQCRNSDCIDLVHLI